MATSVLDRFVVLLGLDSSGVKQGADVAKKSFKETHKEADNLGAGMNGLASMIGKVMAAAAATYGVTKFITSIVDLDAAQSRLSKNIGAGISGLSAWDKAAQGFGGKAGDASGYIKSLSMDIKDIQNTGESANLPFFVYLSKIGVTLQDAAGKAKPVTDVMLSMSDAFRKMGREQAYWVSQKMGMPEGVFNLLMLQRGELRKELSKQAGLAGVTKANGEAAEKAQRSWNDLSKAFEGIQRKVAEMALPALNWLTAGLTKMSDWASHNGTAIKLIFAGLGVVLASAILPVILGIVAAINPATVLFIALGAAITAMMDDYEKWSKGGDSTFDWSAWVKPINQAVKLWNMLGDAINSAKLKWESWNEYIEKNPSSFFDKLQNVFSRVGEGVGKIGDLIGLGESGPDAYNAVNFGKKNGYKSGRAELEHMTIGQVQEKQSAGEYGTVGKYQMTQGTLSQAVSTLHLNKSDLFNEEMQERIFKQYLLGSKQKLIRDYLSGKSNDLIGAAHGAALEWASVKDPYTDKGLYDGPHNKATISSKAMMDALQTYKVSLQQNKSSNTVHNSSRSSEVNVGTVNVHTQATNADGIAKDIGGALKRNELVNMANTAQ